MNKLKWGSSEAAKLLGSFSRQNWTRSTAAKVRTRFYGFPYINQTDRNTMSNLCQNSKKTERRVQLTLRFSWNISHNVKTILALTWNKKVFKKSLLKYLGTKRLLHGTRSTHSRLLITENTYFNEFRFQVRFDFDPDRQYFKSFFLL